MAVHGESDEQVAVFAHQPTDTLALVADDEGERAGQVSLCIKRLCLARQPHHPDIALFEVLDGARQISFLSDQETNLTRAIEDLKKRNIWVVGLAGEAQTLYTQADLTGPLALVVGNEGKGISRLVREHCDLLIRLPMYGHINSLNAAVAGSIALYEALRQREQGK